MSLEGGITRSGFSRFVYVLSAMSGPLEPPGKGKWYGIFYAAYRAYLELAIAASFVTIGLMFISPGVPVEVRCVTCFPVAGMIYGTIRTVDMSVKRSRYLKLMADYMSLYNESPELNEDVDYYSKAIQTVLKLLLLFSTIPMVTMTSIPIIVALLGGPRTLPIPARIPFDLEEHLFLGCATSLVQLCAAYVCTIRLLTFENLFNMFACRQIALTKHLSRELRRILSTAMVDNVGNSLFSKDGDFITKERAEVTAVEELKQWVKNHQMSLRMAKELQNIYSAQLFVQYAFIGIMLCTNAFVVATRTGGNKYLVFCGAYAIGMLSQLLVPCRLGDLIRFESNCIERAIDGTHAYILSSDFYKSWLRLILIRVKVPMKTSALGVFPLDMETAKSFVVTTYSFFTLLNEMRHE